jgi:hypothetical protein
MSSAISFKLKDDVVPKAIQNRFEKCVSGMTGVRLNSSTIWSVMDTAPSGETTSGGKPTYCLSTLHLASLPWYNSVLSSYSLSSLLTDSLLFPLF